MIRYTFGNSTEEKISGQRALTTKNRHHLVQTDFRINFVSYQVAIENVVQGNIIGKEE